MVSTVLDLLVDQNVAATLWVKLPRGEVWQSEIDRYRQSATAAYTLYSLSTHRGADAAPGEPAIDQTSVQADNSPVADSPNPFDADLLEDAEESAAGFTDAQTYPVPLSEETRLRREYFILIHAPQFNSLLLAHRPRSIRSVRETELAESIGSAPAAAEEELERKHLLLGLCCFDLPTIQQVSAGVNQAIVASHASAEIKAAAAAALSMVELQSALDPLLLGALVTSQIRRQEETWRSSALYRKQAESVEHLKAEQEELLKTLHAKDEFLKTVGQELRTPLSTMKTALTLLNSPMLKPPQRQRYMEMLTQECDRQSSLITGVLDLVQIEDTDTPMQPLRLTEVVPGVVSTYQPLAQEKGIMLAYTIPEELPPVSCLNPWLRQIVINLLHNGIKFTPAGGKVWVKAKQQGDFIDMEFRDTGIGIPAAEIPKIFDRFYRVRHGSEDAGGAGLGLSIVQQLVVRCGGSISVKSKLSEGSTFDVLLPIYRA